MYRMTAWLAPYASTRTCRSSTDQVAECADELRSWGTGARARHPAVQPPRAVHGPELRGRAGAAAGGGRTGGPGGAMDAMGLGPEAVVVLHVGGAAGGMERGARALRGRRRAAVGRGARPPRGGERRPHLRARRRAGAARAHGRCAWSGTSCTTTATTRDGVGDREALELALATWPAGVTPKIHYSSPKTAVEERKQKVGRRVERSLVLPQLRAHADLIDPIGFEHFLRETAAGPGLRRDARGKGQGPRAAAAQGTAGGARGRDRVTRLESCHGPAPAPSGDPADVDFFELMERHLPRAFSSVMRRLPSEPRCRLCNAPFGGPGGRVMARFGFGPSRKNPTLCNTCFEKAPMGGVEMEIGVLFADVRGFTSLAEGMAPGRRREAAQPVLRRGQRGAQPLGDHRQARGRRGHGAVRAPALPGGGVAGRHRARRPRAPRGGGLRAAEPWLEVGVGVDIGPAYVGNVGAGDVKDFTALGDVVNTAARLQAQAAPGQIVVSERLFGRLPTPPPTPARRACP